MKTWVIGYVAATCSAWGMNVRNSGAEQGKLGWVQTVLTKSIGGRVAKGAKSEPAIARQHMTKSFQ